jgi:hypothetical protein
MVGKFSEKKVLTCVMGLPLSFLVLPTLFTVFIWCWLLSFFTSSVANIAAVNELKLVLFCCCTGVEKALDMPEVFREEVQPDEERESCKVFKYSRLVIKPFLDYPKCSATASDRCW